jgi:tetratricopeptide (TPR) repeat protein
MNYDDYITIAEEKARVKVYKGAIADYTKAIQIEAKKIYPSNSILDSIFNLVNNKESSLLSYVAKYGAVKYLHFKAFRNRAFEKAMQKDYTEALNDFKLAEEILQEGIITCIVWEPYSIAIRISDNDKADFYCKRAIAKIGLKDSIGATEDFKKATDISDTYKRVFQSKATELTKDADELTAIEYYWFLDAHTQLKMLDVKNPNEVDQIIQICDSFNKKVKRFYVYIHDFLCDAFSEKKDYVLAINELDVIMQHLIDDNPIVWHYFEKKARLCLELGDANAAINNFKKRLNYAMIL